MKKETEQTVETPYLFEGLGGREGPGGAHRVAITFGGGDGSGAELQLDPNVCSVDAFGDPTICTKIAIRMVQATLRLVEEREGKQVFAIDAKDYEGPALRLALLPVEGDKHLGVARMLVLGDDGAVQRIVNLQPPFRRT